MHKCFHILPVLLISLFGCTHLKKTGVLEKRAGYSKTKEKTTTITTSEKRPEKSSEKKEEKTNSVSRTGGKIKKAWFHAHEMPTGDYFGGSWVYLLVEKTKWSLPESNPGEVSIETK